MAKLSEAQLRAIEYLAVPKLGGLTYAEVAAEVGVDERTLRRWRNDDAFYEELKRRVVKNSAKDIPRIVEAVPDIILRDGNAALFRTYLQMHGMLSDKLDVTTAQTGGAVDVDAIRARMLSASKADEGE